MKATPKKMLVLAMGLMAMAAQAQTATPYPSNAPSNVLQLAAQGSVEVQQDVLRITLNTTRQGADANAVQTQLKQALEAALQVAKPQAGGEAMEVRTGNFSLYPNHDNKGKITTWQGTASVVLSGKDLARISTVAGKIQSMTVADVSFDISKELRQKSETQAQAQAIASFKGTAESLSRGFGFSSYSLREVRVSTDGVSWEAAPRAMAMKADAAMAYAPVPVEPGKSTVRVTVQGSVQMR